MTNISRINGNQAIKLSQLMEYNMRHNLLEKSNTKYGGKTKISDPFLTHQN